MLRVALPLVSLLVYGATQCITPQEKTGNSSSPTNTSKEVIYNEPTAQVQTMDFILNGWTFT